MITSHDRPRLREDLVAEAIEDRGVRFIDVIDPDNGNSYRFYDVEYSLACAMDGERDIPGLVRWAQEELGIAPSPRELQTVISTLGDLGYLDRTDVAVASAADPGLVAGVRPGVAAQKSGIEVELGRFQSPPAMAAAPAAEVELGAAGPSAGAVSAPEAVVDVELGRSGAAPAPSLPVPSAAARAGALPRPRTNTPHQEAPELRSKPAVRPSERQVRPAEPAAPRRSEPKLRPSERQVPAAARRSEPKLRPSERQVAGPAGVGPSGPSDPSLNLSLPIRPDDVKEAVRASREMRSVDVPPELMAALEAAEQPKRAPTAQPARPEPMRSERPSAVITAAVPSAAVLSPIAPISGAPLSVSEPISPSSVPPLVPAPRAESRPVIEARPEARPDPRAKSEPRAKASEPRIEYPRAVEARPALTPAPREVPVPAVAAPLPAPRRSSMWIVVVLVIAILGVIAFGLWTFVFQKKAAEPAPVPVPVSVNPVPAEGTPVTPPPPAEPPTAKLALVNGQAVSVKMPVAGALQSVIADGTAVKESDEIARLSGGKVLEQRIAEAKGDLEKRYPIEIARLKKDLEASPNNRAAQAKLAQREARVAQRTKDLAGFESELAKLVLTASAAGKVTVLAKPGARLAVDAEVATIEQDAYLSGAATANAKVEQAAGTPFTAKLKSDNSVTVQCTIETVQDDKFTFQCPVADGFAEGTEVLVEVK